MSKLYLVRHGRAAAGWDVDPNPGLDELGRAQAEQASLTLSKYAPAQLVSSPLLRCQETAAPLAALLKTSIAIEQRVAEILSPEGVELKDRVTWLRAAMTQTWTELGQRYISYRDDMVAFLSTCTVDTVVFSHFIAINAVVGSILGDDRVLIRSFDNCSITTIHRSDDGRLSLVDYGAEADTLIR